MSLPPRPIPTLRQSLGARSGLTGLTRRLLVAVDRYVAGLQPRQLAGLLTLFASFFVVVATASFSALALDGLGKDRQRLDAVASLKAREIETWLDERHSDIGLLARNSVFQALLLPLQRRTDARWPDRLNAWYENLRLTTWLADMCRIHGFRSAEVVDRQGHPLVTSGSPPYQAGNLAELLALVSAARPLGELDLRRGEDGRTFLTFGAHVQATPQHEPLVLVFALDVAESLLPRVETWSHADHSGELLLLRISGGQAEQVKGEPVAQLVAGPDALDDPRSPLAQALRVGGGVFRGPDRQGQVHEAAVRAVQGRPWWIMARIDRDELLAPIVRLAWVGTLLTALGLTGVSALALLLWRQQRARLAEASHLAAELRRSSETALQATRAKTAFLATMSHEIRTPLNAVIGLTHLLRRRSPDGGWQADKLDQVSDAAQHLLAIVNDVLDISRVEAGRLTLEPREFLLAELIRSKVIALVSERAREKGLALIVDIEPALQMPLRGDPLRLAQALLNYVANAVKFTAAGQVRLQARRVEAADPQADAWLVRFEVQDSGPGIAPEHQPHIFQPFRQEDGSTYQRFGGSGLGLSITARLAEVMGGEVGLHSEPGQGSCFWITVRLSPATGSRPPVLRPAQDAWRRLQQHAAGRRLLIAEDNPVNRELMLELLDGLGLEIDLAEDGEAAVALGQARHYDLVLMDMQMPRMDGLQATRQLRQLQGWLACPIVAMTANAFEEDRRACIAAGMNDHLAKPIDPPDFYARLERWLALPESGSSPDALPDTLPDAVLFDPERLLQLTRQRPAAVHRILGQFLQHHDGDVSRLRHHIQADEVPQALAVAHALKGAASQVGAVALGGQAAEIEARLRQRRAVDDGALAALELLWPSTCKAIERWLAAHPAPPAEVRPGFDPPGRLPLAEPPTDEAP